MLRIELSALSALEVRRLLQNARARGQTALVQQLEAELAARPARVEDWTPARMTYAAPAAPAPAVAASARRRARGLTAAAAVFAGFVSGAVVWGVTWPVPSPPAASTARPPPRAAMALVSTPPVAAPAPPAEAAPETIAALPPPVVSAPPARSRRENPCLDLPTAAERLVCGYPALAAQDRRLRSAYERALAAGADPRDLARTQSEWRARSESLPDYQQLSDAYDRLIREIEAAAGDRS